MNVFNRFSLSTFALLICSVTTSYAQQDATALHQRANAAMCSNCHGTEGKTVDGSAVPSINGMPKDYMVLQMKAFKDGRFAHEKHAVSMFCMNSTHYAMDYATNVYLREVGPEPRERELFESIKIEDCSDDFLIYYAPWSKYILPHHVLENPEYDWHYTAYATCNPNMTIDFLRELYDINKLNKYRPSVIFSPITNSIFTYDDIMENSDIPWDYKDFGENGTLTFDFIQENPTICDGVEYLENVCVNEFHVEKEAFLEGRRREYMAAYQIQQWWLKETSNPKNSVCLRRLERDYDSEMCQATPN